MNPHKPVGWQLLIYIFHPYHRYDRFALQKVDSVVFVPAFGVGYVNQFDANQFIFRFYEQMARCNLVFSTYSVEFKIIFLL